MVKILYRNIVWLVTVFKSSRVSVSNLLKTNFKDYYNKNQLKKDIVGSELQLVNSVFFFLLLGYEMKRGYVRSLIISNFTWKEKLPLRRSVESI